jgi:integration host factor subunit beta
MKKSDLVKRIATENPHLYERHVDRLVDAILEVITRALAHGNRAELRGFGTFSVRERKARTGRNPRSGAIVSVERKLVPFFKMGREMRARLNKPDNER